MYFVKIDQLRYPDMTTALQTCYNINANVGTYIHETQKNQVALTGIRTTDLWIAGPLL
jgi:hypothetical protein